MVRFILPAAVALSLGLCLPAMAEDSSYDARLKVAQDYVDETVKDMDMARIIEQMWRNALPQFEQAAGGPLSDKQKDDLQALYMETFAEPMQDIMAKQGAVMAETLTLAEITALRDFYASPEGRAVMQKLPDIMARQQPEIIAMIQGIMPKVLPKVVAIIQSGD